MAIQRKRKRGLAALFAPYFLFLSAASGHWRQHKLRDGTYTLNDLLDITELICVCRENEKRAADAALG